MCIYKKKAARSKNYILLVLLYTEQRNGMIAGNRYGGKGYFLKTGS